MENNDHNEDVHSRIQRVREDLRVIQRELNYAAMQAPADPELMEALNQIPELESIEMLKADVDQMRHFLWFYLQVVTNDSDVGEKLRQVVTQHSAQQACAEENAVNDAFKLAAEALMLRYLADGKFRRPN